MEDVLRNPARVRDQSRDHAPFETIFCEHYPRIVAVLERVLGDRAEAEEAAMDVFSKLYQQPLSPGQDHNFGGWLYRTATRLGLDRLRSARRRRQYEEAAGPELAAGSRSPSPLDGVLRAETCREVRGALSRLKPAQAELLLLRSSGLSYKELAEALGVKATSIGTLLARAEAEFEKQYGPPR
jgi:RNA polymerase sigma-70 factor (ECF subfamily)